MERPARSTIDYAFWVLSFCFGCGAVFHTIAAAVPTVDPEAPAWRHLLFVGINLACIAGFLKRPRLFIPLFAVLLVQQVLSHGGHAIRAWAESRTVDAPSIGVVLVFPTALALLVIDAAREAGRRAR